MLPRVSEAARIFVVAAFLVLVAQGPSFSGRASQTAALGSDGVCTTCTDTNKQTDNTVTQGKDSPSNTQTGDCTDEKMKDPKVKAACEAKGAGTITATDEKGNQITISKDGNNTGIVSQGSGGASNPSAVQQYASGSAADAFLHTPPSAEGQQIIDSAFPGASSGAQTAYPISSGGSDSGNSVSGSDFSGFGTPDSTVPGTALDYSQPLNLNASTRNDFASLASPDLTSASPSALPNYYYGTPTGGFSSPGVPISSISPDALDQAGVWNAYQPLGGLSPSQLSGTVSPSDIFFAQSGYVAPQATGGMVTLADGTQFRPDVSPVARADMVPLVVNTPQGPVQFTADPRLQVSTPDGESTLGALYEATQAKYGADAVIDADSVKAMVDSSDNKITGIALVPKDAQGNFDFSKGYLSGEQSFSGLVDDIKANPDAYKGGPGIAMQVEKPLPQATPLQVDVISASEFNRLTGGSTAASNSIAPDVSRMAYISADSSGQMTIPSNTVEPFANIQRPIPQFAAAPIQDIGTPYAPPETPTAAASQPVAQAPASAAPAPVPAVQDVPAPSAPTAPVSSGSAGAAPSYAQQPVASAPSSGGSAPSYAPQTYRPAPSSRAPSIASLPNFNLPSIVTDLLSSWSVFQPAAGTQQQPVNSNGDTSASAGLDTLAGTANPSATQASGQPENTQPVSGPETSAQVSPSGADAQQPSQQPAGQATEAQESGPSDTLKKVASVLGDILNTLNPFGVTPAQAEPAPQPVRATVTGQASCYDPTNTTSCGGTQYEGGMETASGERYTGNVEATAALQLDLAKKYRCGYAGGTCSARVTDLATGKSIVVRINDNGPLFDGRVIDLSSKAKELLGGGDLPQVQVEILAAKVAPSTQASVVPAVQPPVPTRFVAAATPGQAQQKQANTQPLLQNVSYCIGSSGCTIDENSYINALCQSDTGCAAKDLGKVADSQYPNERPMNDAQERAQEYARQVATAGAKSKGNQPVDVDNCQYAGAGACAQLLDEIQKWNAAHPGQSLVPMLKNPLLIAENLGATAAQDLLKKAAGMSGGSIVEQGAGTVAENDVQRKSAGAPTAPMLFVGTQQYAQDAAQQVRSGNVQNAGVSASSQAEGGDGYKDGTAVLPVAVSAGSANEAQRFADVQKSFAFGKSGKLMDPREAAQAQARGEQLDVYEASDAPNPFDVGAKETHVKDPSGSWYARQGSAAQYVAQKQAEAQSFLENQARALQLQQKLGRAVSIGGTGLTRPIFAQDSGGSRGQQIGVLQTRSDAEVRILAAAKRANVSVVQKSGALLDAQGRRLSLKTVQGGTAPSLPASGWIAGGSGFVARNAPFTYRGLGADAPLRTNQPTLIMHVTEGVTTQSAIDTLHSRGNLSYNVLVGSDRENNVITNLRPVLQQSAHLGRGQKVGFTGLRNSNTLGIACVSMRVCSQNQMKAIAEVILPQLEEQYPGITQRVFGHDEVSYKSGAEGAREANAIRNGLLEQIYGVSLGSALQYQLVGIGEDGKEVALGQPISASDFSTLHGGTSFFSTDASGNPDGKTAVALESLGDLGVMTATLTTDENGNLGIRYDYTPPQQVQQDTRTLAQRARDTAARTYAAAQQQARNLWSSMFGPPAAQSGAQQSGSSSGAPRSAGGGSSSAPAQQVPVQPQPVAPAQVIPASLTCSPRVVNADAKTPVQLSWRCPQGTTSVGSGFSTGGSAEGTTSFAVSTTSTYAMYAVRCVGTQTPQTASCRTEVLHPSVTLVAQPAETVSGNSVTLRWSSASTAGCKLYAPPSVLLSAGGVSGTATSLPLTHSSEFAVRCDTIGSPLYASTTVQVLTDTQPALTTIVP